MSSIYCKVFRTCCRPRQFCTFIASSSSKVHNLRVKKQRPAGGGRFLIDHSKVFDHNNWWGSSSFGVDSSSLHLVILWCWCWVKNTVHINRAPAHRSNQIHVCQLFQVFVATSALSHFYCLTWKSCTKPLKTYHTPLSRLDNNVEKNANKSLLQWLNYKIVPPAVLTLAGDNDMIDMHCRTVCTNQIRKILIISST